MNDPKTTIYNKLNQIAGVTVYQERPEVIAVFPSITFRVIDNTPEYTLDRGIGRQNVRVRIDIWTESSSEGGLIYSALVAKMLEIDYLCVDYVEPADPDGYFHISTNFIF